MSEQSIKPKLLIDKEAGERFTFVVRKGREMFNNSPLLDSGRPISYADLEPITSFHKEVSPQNPQHPFRLDKKERGIAEGEIADSSFYSNWESPGGPLESINLARDSAPIILDFLISNLKLEDDSSADWVRKAMGELKSTKPEIVAAASALHDEGREITHIFYTNDLIGTRLLRKIGIREDIVSILPDEKVMLTPQTESMDEAIQNLPIAAVIVFLADDFGKRVPGTNRLFQPEDFSQEEVENWAENYLSRPFSGRPSDRFGRENMNLHVANVPRYLSAMDNWIRALTGKTLKDLALALNQELASSLPGLAEQDLKEQVVLSSNELKNNQIFDREVEIGSHTIRIKAVTQIGEPNKRFNEDGALIIAGIDSLFGVVVDGGSQLEQVESLGDRSGGVYIRDQVVKYSSIQNLGLSPGNALADINSMIRRDMEKSHPDITFTPNSKNIPYGSIAGFRINTIDNTLEIANAGDVFVVSVDREGNAKLVSGDDVYEYDKLSFQEASKAASDNKVSIREVFGSALDNNDGRFSAVRDQMMTTIENNVSGKISRIMGLDNFRTHETSVLLDHLQSVYIFSDGAVPAGIDIHTQDGLNEFVGIVSNDGFEKLIEERKSRAELDPNFEKFPRFRDLDDMMIVGLNFD
jgi:hypothetical protein